MKAQISPTRKKTMTNSKKILGHMVKLRWKKDCWWDLLVSSDEKTCFLTSSNPTDNSTLRIIFLNSKKSSQSNLLCTSLICFIKAFLVRNYTYWFYSLTSQMFENKIGIHLFTFFYISYHIQMISVKWATIVVLNIVFGIIIILGIIEGIVPEPDINIF
jgi:hypothetical protein